MQAEIEMELEKMYRDADEIKRREENSRELKRAWKRFLKRQEEKNVKQGK